MFDFSMSEMNADTISNENKTSAGTLSILKGFAKTVFNKCAKMPAGSDPKQQLRGLELAKFEAAEEMARKGETTRYAFYKHKNDKEVSYLQGFRNILNDPIHSDGKKRDLSNWAMRKLATIVDKLDPNKLQSLQSDQELYKHFMQDAYDIAVAHDLRSKSKKIEAKLEDALLKQDERETISFDAHDLHQIILDEINKDDKNQDSSDLQLTLADISLEITSVAKHLDQPLRMMADNKKQYGVPDNAFRLLKNFIAGSGSNQDRPNRIKKMAAFLTAANPDLMVIMITDLKEAHKQQSFDTFINRHGKILMETYKATTESGFLVKAKGVIQKEQLYAFVDVIDHHHEGLSKKDIINHRSLCSQTHVGAQASRNYPMPGL